jgi:hypothetical protein
MRGSTTVGVQIRVYEIDASGARQPLPFHTSISATSQSEWQGNKSYKKLTFSFRSYSPSFLRKDFVLEHIQSPESIH